MRLLQYIKASFAVTSIVYIAGGLCLLIWPGISMVTLCTALGIVSILQGVVRLAGYFSRDLYRLAFQFDLAVGILSIAVGLGLILHSRDVVSFLPTLTGAFILVDSILRLQTAVDAKLFGMQKWWVILVLSIAGGVLGMLLLLRPSAVGRVLARLIGASLMIYGGENLLVCSYTIKIPRHSHSEDGVIDVEYTEING